MSDDPRAGLAPSASTLRRTWPQRLLVSVASILAVASFLGAGLVWFAQQRLEERQIIEIDPVGLDPLRPGEAEEPVAEAVEPSPDFSGGPLTSNPNEPVETFPSAGTGARNILITGADNNACLDPTSRFADAFGDRAGMGERSDTIMLWRVNPDTARVAILSFPRDLWIRIAGRSSKGRINGAYTEGDPQRLIDTIQENFGITTDHFVQVDFCAFKELVDSVGGVAVPFERPVRDGATGLAVPQAGCFTFTGEHALAYVRSRKLQYQTEGGEWVGDVSSDLGRISRQQDFVRRVGDELLANAFSPEVVRTLFDVSRDYVVTDQDLTIDRILSLAGILQRTDPADITTYQIEARNAMIQGNSVLVMPDRPSENMEAVFDLFRGEISLAERPEQSLDDVTGRGSETTAPPTTVPIVDPDATTTSVADGTSTTDSADGSAPDESTTTIPTVEVEDITYGVVPDGDVSCT
ncbi:LCP family protein [Ilumatobacter sp.]|uniref:LCP family protein n=1 Tax=Ilumatobacter sp. TaxID=1967498 RepID=UPI003B51B389